MYRMQLHARQEAISKVLDSLSSKVKQETQPLLSTFVKSLFKHASARDLSEYDAADLNGLTMANWQHFQSWDRLTPKVSVFNPNIEEQEWQTTHTVICVLVKDMPFVLDSVRLILNRQQANIYSIFHSSFDTKRNESGDVLTLDNGDEGEKELLIYFEIDHRSDKTDRAELVTEIQKVLFDVSSVVQDYQPMVAKVQELMTVLSDECASVDESELEESKVFLKWLIGNHFTFLGYDEYEIRDNEIEKIQESSLGLSKSVQERKPQSLDSISKEQSSFLFNKELLAFVKSGRRSTVHRPAYCDYIIVKKYNEKGEVIGGRRLLGLYTSVVYNNSPKNIPVVRKKIKRVLELSELKDAGHNFKELSQILHTYPRDELIQASAEELFSVANEVLSIQERKKIRLFFRKDVYDRFLIAILYIPRDIYNTQLREEIRKMLMDRFDVEDWDFTTFFSESVLARTRFVFRLKSPIEGPIDVEHLENQVILISRQWSDELLSALIEATGEEQGLDLHKVYYSAFPASYRETYSARIGVTDIQRMEDLYSDNDTCLKLSFYRSRESEKSVLKLKIFHQDSALLLSDLVPVLENLGLKVIDEFPFQIQRDQSQCVWIYDFSLLYEPQPDFDPKEIKGQFSDAFINIWYGRAENDAFNRLILKAGLTWREVAMLRAYSRYMKQIKFSYSETFIAETLFKYPELASQLAWLFAYRFNPIHAEKTNLFSNCLDGISELIESVDNLSEDKVLRRFVELMSATFRTNFYQLSKTGDKKNYLSFKIAPQQISEIPLPRPMFEIYVYSPRMEGVHLRGGKVARGGLRWSDRIEDFRTEVLGLVKAQQVKNAVIVPVGAKGGFVAKKIADLASREEIQKEGIECYKLFIKGLLDITDNLKEGSVCAPEKVVRHDQDDPYLVVAADKGTATFSDIANEVAIEYGHWLGDAFASGGSQGYDHKGMGITAKGAWVSVQRHFREEGIDVQNDSIRVIGIGDMAGDVFGNGMLRSEKIKLVAAFNHLNIFVDPDPNPETSFNERDRLFKLPRSSWEDYGKELISKGGGIFKRSAKSIPISAEMKMLFGITENQLAPNDLIKKILKSKVDLIWNGGIGTYIKSSSESNADVGDKANDALRVNGNELQTKVIGEGGNLGCTQLGRIEYALNGGRCFTDSIDNAGGVDCSDHEVNIKILLDDLVVNGDLTEKQRNQWLVKMTDDVSNLVLTNNYQQAQSLSLSYSQNYKQIEEYRRHIADLESQEKLNRELEYIPSDETISDRKASGAGLTRPELSVLISYSKGDLKEQLINSNISNDSYIEGEVESAFPTQLVKEFKASVYQHKLKNEIVATQVANDVFNHMGITFLHRLQESTGASTKDIAIAYIIARDVFGLHDLWREIETLDQKVSTDLQYELMIKSAKTVRRASRWFIKNYRLGLSASDLVPQYQKPLNNIFSNLKSILYGAALDRWQQSIQALVEQGLSESLATKAVSTDYLYNCLGVISVSKSLNLSEVEVASAYFKLGDLLNLDDFAKQLDGLTVATHWQTRARESYRDDLEWQQRRITQGVLSHQSNTKNLADSIEAWIGKNEILVNRWHRMVKEILGTSEPEFSMYSVAIRELLDLSQASDHDT